MVNIPIRHANPPGQRVRDVRHGEHVAAAQSVSHVMRGIICPTGHVNSVNQDITVRATMAVTAVHRDTVRLRRGLMRRRIAI